MCVCVCLSIKNKRMKHIQTTKNGIENESIELVFFFCLLGKFIFSKKIHLHETTTTKYEHIWFF